MLLPVILSRAILISSFGFRGRRSILKGEVPVANPEKIRYAARLGGGAIGYAAVF
jgi:hypothetical protein